MHGTKTGDAAVAGQPPSAAIPADYPEWISSPSFEIGLLDCADEAQMFFPFAQRLANPTQTSEAS